MIINGNALLAAAPIKDMVTQKQRSNGFSWGLTECGYDIRIKQDVTLFLGRRFILASAIEEFDVPNNLMGRVLNKSSWARLGLDASMTTNLEPGWKGFLTLEIVFHGNEPVHIPAGSGIAQVLFHQLQDSAEYNGKYQNQKDEPVPSKWEE